MAATILIVAGCANDAAAPDTSSVTSNTDITLPSLTSTLAPAEPTSTPTLPTPGTTGLATPDSPAEARPGGYLLVDRAGVRRIDRDGIAHVLVDGPVDWAADDGTGGVVYRPADDDATIRWLPAGRDASIDTGIVSGIAGTTPTGPAIVTTLRPTGTGPCESIDPDGGEVDEITVVPLDPTDGVMPPAFVACQTEGADDGYAPESFRNGHLLRVHVEAAGWIDNDRELVLTDPDGDLIDLPETSFGRPVAWWEQPRELRALLSADATQLAVRQRLDNRYSNGPDPDTGEIDEAAWERLTASIPSTVRVVELTSGEIRYQTEVPYGVELIDFDGPLLVVFDGTASTVVDTQGIAAPTRIAGRVVLVRSGASDTAWPPTAPEPLRRGDTGPWVSHLQLRLRLLFADADDGGEVDGIFGPGTEAAVTMFQQRNDLVPDGIVGPATWAVLLAEPRRELSILGNGGIATVGRETTAAVTLELLGSLLGPPDRNEPVDPAGDCVEGADWVDCVFLRVVETGSIISWDGLGLDILISDQDADDPTLAAAPHFGGWRLRGADGSRPDVVVTTGDGLRIGSTFGDVHEARPGVGLYLDEGLLDMFGATDADGELIGRIDLTWQEQARAIEAAQPDGGAILGLDGPTPLPADDVVAVLGSALVDAIVIDMQSTFPQ
jgi:hypothetical protein